MGRCLSLADPLALSLFRQGPPARRDSRAHLGRILIFGRGLLRASARLLC